MECRDRDCPVELITSYEDCRQVPTSLMAGYSDDPLISSGEVIMPEQSKRGRSQDRAKVAGGQKHEVAYESGKTGSSGDAVREAVKTVGNSRKNVESELKKK